MVRLIDAGMCVARINLSHGTIKGNLKILRQFQQAKRLRPHRTCALMVDVRGREIRMSKFKEGTLRVRSGNNFSLFGGEFHNWSDAKNLRVNSDNIQRSLKQNDVVYIDDGMAVGIVTEVSLSGIKLEIKSGGIIKSNCSVKFVGGK